MSCQKCFQGAIHTHNVPQGYEKVYLGKKCYIVEPTDLPLESTSVILFITDAFGLNLINSKLLADEYAQKIGCRVIIPDIIPGGPTSLSLIDYLYQYNRPVAWYNLFSQARRLISGLGVLSILLPFLYRAAPPKSYPGVLAYTQALRNDLPAEAKLGVAGFCWGGYHSTRLCTETFIADGSSKQLISAQFCGHPSGLTVPNMLIDAISTNVPYSLAVGDRDVVLSKSTVDSIVVAARKIIGEEYPANNYEIKIYKDCGHGFAVRGHPDDKAEMKGAEQAKVQAVEWFKKHL